MRVCLAAWRGSLLKQDTVDGEKRCLVVTTQVRSRAVSKLPPSNLFSVRNFIGGVIENYRLIRAKNVRATNESSVRIKTKG
jgi:hypothetical protein